MQEEEHINSKPFAVKGYKFNTAWGTAVFHIPYWVVILQAYFFPTLLLQEVILKPENLSKYALKFWTSRESSFAPAVTYSHPSIL